MPTIRSLSFNSRFVAPPPLVPPPLSQTNNKVEPTKVEPTKVASTKVVQQKKVASTKVAPRKQQATRTFLWIKCKLPKRVVVRRERSVALIKAAASVTREELSVEIPDKIAAFESEYLHEYLRLYATLKEMCAITEARYIDNDKRSTRDVYALMALYSQQREVIADIRSIKSLTEHVHVLVREVLQPFTSALAQNILDTFYHVRKVVKEVCREEEVDHTLRKLDDLLREQGKYLQQRYNLAEGELFRQLSDDRKPAKKITVASTKMGTTR